jgi:hypothetical protein
MQDSPGTDPTAEVAGSGQGGVGSRSRRRVAAERGGSPEFKFSWATVVGFLNGLLLRDHSNEGERVYANHNRRRAATKPGNGEAARPVLIDGEDGLRWSFGSKDVRQGFLELPSSFSTDQLLWSVAKNSNLVAT